MSFLTDWITNWLHDLLVNGIMGNLGNLFTNVNNQVGEVATNVGMTPGTFNPGVFALIKQISETVVLPIAGLLLTFVMTWELIQLIIERNNLHEIDTWIFFKWIFKTAIAVLLLSNTFNIVTGIFEVAQSAIQQAAGIISGSTGVTSGMMATLQAQLQAMDIGPLLGLWMQSFLVQIIVLALNIVVFVIVYGRMIEIYILTSLAPLPMATLTSRELGSMGQNYLKSLLAVAFQGLLLLVCVAIYAILVQSIVTSGDPFGAIWATIGYTVLLCFTMFKTGTVAKSIFAAH